MESYKNNGCSPGYWTGGVEAEAAVKVSTLPKTINACVIANEDAAVIGTDNLSQAIYHNANHILKLVNSENDYPAEKIKIKKLCEIDMLPKNGSHADSLSCCVYHVVPDDHKHINFIYVTHDNAIYGYARFHIKQRQVSTAEVYGNQALLAIEAMETYQRGVYSFGTALVQMIYEYSVNSGLDGRVALYSVNDSGQFYHKVGFTPLDPSVYSVICAGHHIDGKIMFFTDAAINQWRVRASQTPILLEKDKIVHTYTNETILPSVSKRGVFGNQSKSSGSETTPHLSASNAKKTKK